MSTRTVANMMALLSEPDDGTTRHRLRIAEGLILTARLALDGLERERDPDEVKRSLAGLKQLLAIIEGGLGDLQIDLSH